MWFAGKLAEHGHRPRWPAWPTGCTRRSVTARRPRPRRRAEAAADPRVAALWRNLAELRALAEAAGDELAPLAALLDGGPLAEVPLLAGDVHDLAGLGEIQRPPLRSRP